MRRQLLIAACAGLLVAMPRGNVGASGPALFEDRAVELLRQYIQIDTTVPPGNELRAALFYKSILEQEGIPVQIDEFSPGRANVLAFLKGDGSKRPLILANHMDVVPADPSRWSTPPFAAAVKDGILYGRGAEDMKSEGILQVVAMLRLKREAVPLARDVVFLGTADEEEGFGGARRAISPDGFRSRLKDAEYLITEGAENVMDDAGKAVSFSVETGEKGPYWLTLRTTGTPGHGSRPMADSAPNRLVQALDRIRRYRPAMRVLPAVERFFKDQAPHATGAKAEWYRDLERALRDPAAATALYDDREVSALLRNTISITVIRAGYKTNVIPGTAEAELDVRLLPGQDPKAFMEELRRVIDDPTVEILPPKDFFPPNSSPTDSELCRTVERVLARHYPGVSVTSSLLTGATESVLYRSLGIMSYGFTPLLATTAELDTQHGDDERIHVSSVRAGTGIFYEVILELCRR